MVTGILHPGRFVQLNVLIASTTWFALPARIAMAFSQAGASVSGIVPAGNPLTTVSSVCHCYTYSARRPARSLQEAIALSRPDLIVPCDDRVVEHLHALHSECRQRPNVDWISALIERSLGSPSAFPLMRDRGSLLALAAELGINVPTTNTLHTQQDLRVWLTQYGYPAILKIDGSWGGAGVRLVRSWSEAQRAYGELLRPFSPMTLLRYASYHDFFPLFADRSSKRSISIQKYVDGHCANSMFACLHGEVLDHLSVDTIYAADPLGSSTVVRIIDRPEMLSAGKKLVETLSISGFCGLDFVIEAESGQVFLIELNPRTTQIGHIRPQGHSSLVDVLYNRLVCNDPSPHKHTEEIIALFPHAFRAKPTPALSDMVITYQDIPWNEPALTHYLLLKPWNRRHLSALLYSACDKIIKGLQAR